MIIQYIYYVYIQNKKRIITVAWKTKKLYKIKKCQQNKNF